MVAGGWGDGHRIVAHGNGGAGLTERPGGRMERKGGVDAAGDVGRHAFLGIGNGQICPPQHFPLTLDAAEIECGVIFTALQRDGHGGSFCPAEGKHLALGEHVVDGLGGLSGAIGGYRGD